MGAAHARKLVLLLQQPSQSRRRALKRKTRFSCCRCFCCCVYGLWRGSPDFGVLLRAVTKQVQDESERCFALSGGEA